MITTTIYADFIDNSHELWPALGLAWVDVNHLLQRRFTMEITSNKWTWPNLPSPRDIVDKGQLRASYKGFPRINPETDLYEFDHEWNVNHALYVHEGYEHKSGSVWPGRPWTKKPLDETDRLMRDFRRSMVRHARGIIQ